MKIGLIGWYGHNNAGDERILYCLRRFFDGHDMVVTSGFDDAVARIEELNSCGFVLLGGGGLILRGTGKYSQLIEQLKTRFGCVGISVEAYHADNLSLIEAIKEKAEFILVRDARSRELLDSHFKTIIGPDLTFLYPYEPAAPVKADVCGLNLRPWRFWPGEHNGYLDRVMRQLDSRITNLEHFYPFAAKWDKKRVLDIIRLRFETIAPIALYFEYGVVNDLNVLSSCLQKVPEEFTSQYLQGCRYLVGMRLHALIFACQVAVPFLSLSYQPKNEEFCKSLCMPELSLDINKSELLSSAIDNLKSEHAMIRSNLIDMSSTNYREITTIMTAIRHLICPL